MSSVSVLSEERFLDKLVLRQLRQPDHTNTQTHTPEGSRGWSLDRSTGAN